MKIVLLYFHEIRNVVVMVTQDAESYSVTSHTLLRAINKKWLCLSLSPDIGTMNVTPRYTLHRLTTEIT